MAFKLPNPPSIPSHENVFGYEQTSNGELIQQQNPKKTFSGSFNDCVGPGQYEIKHVKKKGWDWHSSKVPRFSSVQKRNEVGPGNYENKAVNLLSRKPKGTSCFVSKVPKANMIKPQTCDDFEHNEISPGPGYYDPTTETFKKQRQLGKVQPFGSTEVKFLGYRFIQSTVIGPGEYENSNEPYVL